jgi:inosine-uridine nucleoside N-ribohydrolase
MCLLLDQQHGLMLAACLSQGVAKVVKNVARILEVAERLDVPFYLGSDEPLLGEPIDAAFVRVQSLLALKLLPLTFRDVLVEIVGSISK